MLLSDAGHVLVGYNGNLTAQPIAQKHGWNLEDVRALLYRSEEFYALERGTLAHEQFRAFVCHRLCLPNWHELSVNFDEIWRRAMTHPIDAIVTVWKELRQHLPIVAASNMDPVRRDHLMQLEVVASCFTVADTFSCNLGIRKGDPGYFERLLRHVGYDAADALFVDDIEEYVLAARAAGIRSVRLVDEKPFAQAAMLREMIALGVPARWMFPAVTRPTFAP